MATSFRTLMIIAAMIGEAFALQVGARVEHADDASALAIVNSDCRTYFGGCAGVAGHPGAATSYTARFAQGIR